MYYIKIDKIKEIKDGRTARYISETLGVSEGLISQIFNGRRCTKITAKALISLRENIAFGQDKLEELLLEYFDKII